MNLGMTKLGSLSPGLSQRYNLPVSHCRRANADYCAKSFQSCPTLCDPIDSSPPGSPVPRILQVRTLEWVAISFSNAWKWKAKVKSLSHARLFMTPWTEAYQAPPSMGFSRQEYWGGLPLPSSRLCEMYALKQLCGHSLDCLSLRLEWKLIIFSPLAIAESPKFAGIWRAAHSEHLLSEFEISQLNSITSTSFVCKYAS